MAQRKKLCKCNNPVCIASRFVGAKIGNCYGFSRGLTLKTFTLQHLNSKLWL